MDVKIYIDMIASQLMQIVCTSMMSISCYTTCQTWPVGLRAVIMSKLITMFKKPL